MSIERIVRPFQINNVFTARIAPPVQPAEEPSDLVHLEWEGSAATSYSEEPAPGTMGITVEWKEDEERRVTETVRVENPEDPSQFVEVEKYKEATFKNLVTGQEQKFSFGSGE